MNSLSSLDAFCHSSRLFVPPASSKKMSVAFFCNSSLEVEEGKALIKRSNSIIDEWLNRFSAKDDGS